MGDAYFHLDGGNFVATAFTRGPWAPTLQHGGPFSALLGRAIERHGADADRFRVVRVTVDMLRPVPIGRVEVRVEPVRLGTKAQWISARLLCNDRELALATGLRIRRTPVELPEIHCPPLPPPPPPGGESFEFPFFGTEVGYHSSVEVSIAAGVWGARGPVAAWLRPRIALIDGESMSALERVLVVADAANGVTMVADPARFSFVNPDLTVYLRRDPVGDWIGLDGRVTPEADGTGLGQSVIHDIGGEVGRCLQSLIIARQEIGGA